MDHVKDQTTAEKQKITKLSSERNVRFGDRKEALQRSSKDKKRLFKI